MPNNTGNNIHMTGPSEILQGIADAHFNKDGCLDFNTIVPRPACMNIAASSNVARFAEVLRITDNSIEEFIGGARTIQELSLGALLRDDPDLINTISNYKSMNSLHTVLREAVIHNNNLIKHGHTDWYSWSVDNWGTKWNGYDGSYHLSTDDLTFDFESAWSPPTQVMYELAELYPEVDFTHHYIDEGGGFAGIATYGAGTMQDDVQADSFNEFATEHFGWEFEDEEDENEED